MRWKRVYISVILGIMGIFLLVHGRAFSSEAYFTLYMEIKGQILRAIEECKRVY